MKNLISGKINRAAIYVRLSKEDGDKIESDSIVNQKELILDYLKDKADIEVRSVRVDDGFSGANFDRPAFKLMLEDIRTGEIDCVIVKGLSRFGRNFVEAGRFLNQEFPLRGVRFIAINDQYDTLQKKSSSDDIVIPFKNLVNDFYAKDISRKINTSLETKQHRGEFIGAFAPYGYKKSTEDKHQLVIDENAAPTVYQIFMWKAEGVGNTTIARRLNEADILCPAMYHYKLGHYSKKKPVGAGAIWQGQMVKLLTSNPVYAGHMAQGKTKKALCDGLPTTVIPCSEWIVVPNTHECRTSHCLSLIYAN